MADSITTTDTKRLGYGGSAQIVTAEDDDVQALITSGSFSTTISPSYLEPLQIPPEDDYTLPEADVRRSRILHADGTEEYSGDLSFDVTERMLDIITKQKLLKRRYKLKKVGINDGENVQVMDDCFLTSLSLSGSPGGIIEGSMSFTSANAPYVPDSTISNEFIRHDMVDRENPKHEPLGYWYSGNTDVRDWTFTMNQNTQPVYGNTDGKSPLYIIVGLVTYTLSVTTYSQQQHDAIDIQTKNFTIKGATTSQEYAFGGPTDLGSYSHNFESAVDADTGSDAVVIEEVDSSN